MLGSRCKPLSFPSNGKDSSSVACCWALLAFLLVFFIPYEKNCFLLFAATSVDIAQEKAEGLSFPTFIPPRDMTHMADAFKVVVWEGEPSFLVCVLVLGTGCW